MIFRNHSDLLLNEHFWLLDFFFLVENSIFLQDSLMNSKFKRISFIWNRYILYLNAFCFNFYQCNAFNALMQNCIEPKHRELEKILKKYAFSSGCHVCSEISMWSIFESQRIAFFVLSLVFRGQQTRNSSGQEISLITLQNSPTCPGPWFIARKQVFPFLLLLIALNEHVK